MMKSSRQKRKYLQSQIIQSSSKKMPENMFTGISNAEVICDLITAFSLKQRKWKPNYGGLISKRER